VVEFTRFRNVAVALGAFLLLYLSWQLFAWIPGSTQDVGDLLILPVDAAAVCAAWWASRRCAGSSKLRSFWRLLAVALAAETIGDVVQAVYDIGLHRSPYPSPADPFYLAFYPLLLLALRPSMRVLLMSGFAQPILDAGGHLDAGMALVEKPFSGPGLLAKVAQAIERAG
jgi:hypothetical protein